MSTYGYGQVLMDSDDEGHELNQDEGPVSHRDYAGGGSDGHLVAGSQSLANVSVTPASTGVFGAALHGFSRPRDYTDTLQGTFFMHDVLSMNDLFCFVPFDLLCCWAAPTRQMYNPL